MKLGKLNAAIDAAPAVFIRTSGYGLVELRKGSIKAQLKAKHTGGKAEETGLRLDDDHAFAPDPAGRTA
jgi:hypothetical protein